MVEPNRLRRQVAAEGAEGRPRDRPISPRLPLLVGGGVGVIGLALFLAGASWSQRVGLGVVSLGAGIALLAPVLRSIRVVRAVAPDRSFQRLPLWLRVLVYLPPIGYGIAAACLAGFGVFVLVTAIGR